VVIYHNGHETESCIANYDGVVDHFNSLGEMSAYAMSYI
jgi:hypothetical protein